MKTLRTPLTALALLSAAPFSTGPVYAQAAVPVAQVDAGRLRGEVADGVESWKGVPFAAPPLGRLRWRAPQPAAPWSGVRDATAYNHDCMQKPFPSDAAPLGTQPAEDCLYANIWRPVGAKTKLPVLVWIYGGGFVNGGASPPTYAGANMAKQGILFFSFNYRVGRFGAFAFPELTRENPDQGRLGNYGIMDQIAALKWVKRNIAAFGGDPDNVTIVGESAGGMSVHDLVTSPEARGLFEKGVIMSGGNGQSDPTKALAEAEQVGVNFARSQGVDPNAPDALAKLRALSAEQVTDGLSMMQLFRPNPGPPTYTGPFPDGKVVVDQGKAYADGDFAHVPIVVGATSADMGGKSGFMIAGADQVAATLSGKGVPVWEYRFSYVADSIGKPGAQHASDIPFFFDNARIKYGAQTTPKDVEMGRTISRYIVDFVKRGDPNGSGLPHWPRYSASTNEIMDFSAEGKAVPEEDPRGAEPPRK